MILREKIAGLVTMSAMILRNERAFVMSNSSYLLLMRVLISSTKMPSDLVTAHSMS